MPYSSSDSQTNLFWAAGESCVWSTARGLFAGLALLIGFAVFVPLEQLQPIVDTPENGGVASSGRHCIRAISLTADGHQAWIVRYPAILQRVQCDTGKITFDRTLEQSYDGGLKPTVTTNEAVVYGRDHKTLLRPFQPPHEPITILESDREWVDASPMHDRLATCHNSIVEIWSLSSKTRLFARELACAVSRLCWSPDGRHLLVVLTDGNLQVLAAETLALEHARPTDFIGGCCLTWAANGRHAAAFYPTGGVVIWDLEHETIRPIPVEQAYLYTCALSPHGERVAIPGHNGRIVLVDPDEALPPTTMGSAAPRINALCFSADGTTLLVGRIDGGLECWSVTKGTILWSLDASLNKTTPARAEHGLSPRNLEPEPVQTRSRTALYGRGASWASTRS